MHVIVMKQLGQFISYTNISHCRNETHKAECTRHKTAIYTYQERS